MHWVGRGPEPEGLDSIRLARTDRWVAHYRDGVGNRPNDSEWRRFHGDLIEPFHGLCAYCEEGTQGEVDHFRPISRFPILVYEWFNWVFACQHCNRSKSNRWPVDGYVDPCAEYSEERAERYFAFDTKTGAVIPKADLPADRYQKAGQTITDLRLNASYHLRTRLYILDVIDSTLNRFDEDSEEDWAFLGKIIGRSNPFSSFARAVLEEHGFEIED